MNASPSRRRLRAVLVVCLLVIAGAAPAAAAGGGGALEASATGPAVASIADAGSAQTDNETVRHRHPDEYAREADGGAFSSWLEGELASRLGRSSVHLSEGDYDLAREFVDEEYEQLLSDYVEVADEEARDERADDVERASEEHRALIDALERYNATHDTYRETLDGNETRARGIARELEGLAVEINQSTAELVATYESIRNESEVNLTATIESIRTANADVQETQAAVRDRVFVGTILSVRAADDTASFRDPLSMTGSLETIEGAPVANERIRLAVGERTQNVTTDETGAFSLTYRPVSVPADADAIRVAYVPERTAPYLESEATANVSIDPVDADLDLSATPDRAAFGDRIEPRGLVSVDGVAVPGLALDVVADGERLGTVETDETGTLNGSVELSAAVEDGDRTLRVEPTGAAGAVGVDAESTLTVTETATTLSLAAERAGPRTLRVAGTLAADGTAVEGRTIDVRVDGTTAATVETDENGTFAGTVEHRANGDGTVTVEAAFDGAGSNLAGTSEGATVAVAAGASDGGLLDSPVVLAGIALLLLLLAGAGVWYWRARRTATDETGTESGSTDEQTTDSIPAATPGAPAGDALLADAESALSAGRAATAVERAYAAARSALGARIDDPSGLTHWEFFEHYRERGEGVDDLRTVTEGYERATFAPVPTDEATAEAVLERARRLCAGSDTRDGAPADD
ncbi:hypothetical protein [Halovivax limisalsi]|uniref:hypothetical protein n=1 Tax=Halovivax limisalsi TaxID=1453760 RepID=UPI001FFCA4EA|nr:hypothetical protein [Halovivax limisalsi]